MLNMLRKKRALILFLAVATFGSPPYERTEKVLQIHGGEALFLIRSYVDGIFEVDPVQFIIRDDQGSMVFETEYGRNVSVYCQLNGICFLFLFDGAFSFLPHKTYKLEDRSVSEVHSFWIRILGSGWQIWENIIGYLLASAFFLVLFLILHKTWQRNRNISFLMRKPVSVLLVGLCLCFFLFLSYIVQALSRLSVLVLCAFILFELILIYPVRMFASKRIKTQCHS